MPFERCDEREDPEVVAEREYEKLSNSSTGSGRSMNCNNKETTPTSTPSTPGALSRSSEALPGSPSRNSNGGVANGKNVSKIAKAEKKKRSRGVSGSSIKKDGGRFNLGFENMDAYNDISDDEPYEDFERYVVENYGQNGIDHDDSDDCDVQAPISVSNDCDVQAPISVSNDCDVQAPISEDTESVQKALLEAVRQEEVIHDSTTNELAMMLSEHLDEAARLAVLDRALDAILESDVWNQGFDRMSEYKCVCVIAKLLADGLFSMKAFNQFLKEQSRDTQSIRMFTSVEIFVEEDAPELKGNLLKEPPSELTDLARELVQTGSVNLVADALRGCPFFHADFVHQLCVESLFTMNMDTMFYAVKALKDLVLSKELTVSSVNSGVSRMLCELRDLEKDLPAASSLALLLVSYATESPACIDYRVYRKCPRPKTFLRKRTNSCGRLSIVEGEGECTQNNFIAVDE